MSLRYTIRIIIALGLAGLIYFIGIQGCSPTMYFTNTTNQKDDYCDLYPDRSVCNPLSGPEITSPEEPSKEYEPFIYRLSLGKVDMVFVIDNSSSMAKEHKSLARQFRYFLNEIKDVDYHIAVITTDISSSPDNPVRNAYYQDGKFIRIGGSMFLRNHNIGEKPSEEVVESFQKAIVREETLKCDSTSVRSSSSSSGDQYDIFYGGNEDNFDSVSSLPKCPSSDERGIYALNLAVENPGQRNFFRPEVHTMFIILSDEDERSGREYIEQFSNDRFSDNKYEFEYLDHPVVLVEKLINSFPGKTFSFYPIMIVPGDNDCLEEQNRYRNRGQGGGRGYYGREYYRLARVKEPELKGNGQILKGQSISICDKHYGSQLNKIALSAHTIQTPLPCANPEHVFVYINNKKIRASGSAVNTEEKYIVELEEIPLNALLEVEFLCDASQIFPSALGQQGNF